LVKEICSAHTHTKSQISAYRTDFTPAPIKRWGERYNPVRRDETQITISKKRDRSAEKQVAATMATLANQTKYSEEGSPHRIEEK
jgi:hypothetical protein